MTLGELINQYLNEHHMSMRKFAAISGVSHAYVSFIVNGSKPNGEPIVPGIDKYRAFAKAMGMDVNDMIAILDDKIAWGSSVDGKPDIILSEDEKHLIRLYRQATDRDKDIIATVLKPYEEDTSFAAIS